MGKGNITFSLAFTLAIRPLSKAYHYSALHPYNVLDKDPLLFGSPCLQAELIKQKLDIHSSVTSK